jgi:hypothetical protein
MAEISLVGQWALCSPDDAVKRNFLELQRCRRRQGAEMFVQARLAHAGLLSKQLKAKPLPEVFPI